MKKQHYHKLTILFSILTILLLLCVGFLMCYSDGVFTLGSFRFVLVGHTQDPIPQPSLPTVDLPALPTDIVYQNPNGVSNRVRHWDETTHEYIEDTTSQYVYTVSSQTPPSTQMTDSDTNVYIIPMGHKESVLLAQNVYDNIVQEIEQVLYQQVQKHNIVVTYAITYEYKNKTDIRPIYLRLEVYTPQDDGKTINWNVLLYNNTH